MMSELSPYTPRWVQIVDALRARITDGTYPVGSKLPSESELMKEFGVSRPTVQRAMQDMAARGQVKREHGVGSFVQAPVSTVEDTSHPALGILDRSELHGPEAQVEVVAAPLYVADRLGLAEGARVHLRRFVSLFDAIPSELVALWTPLDVAKASGLDRSGPLSVPVRRLLNGAGERLTRVEERLSARPASVQEARMLDLVEGAALITILASVIDTSGRTVLVADVLLPGSLHELEDSYTI